MRQLFADLLPDPLISRRSQANFSHSFLHAFNRSFVETWSGQGVWITLSLTPNTSWIRGGSRSLTSAATAWDRPRGRVHRPPLINAGRYYAYAAFPARPNAL